MCLWSKRASMAFLIPFTMNLVSPGKRSRKKRGSQERMGWHFHQKGQKEMATGQGKEAHSPVLHFVCICRAAVDLQFDFFPLHLGIFAVERYSKAYWKGQIAFLCVSLLSVNTLATTQGSVKRLYCQKHSSKPSIISFIMFFFTLHFSWLSDILHKVAS